MFVVSQGKKEDQEVDIVSYCSEEQKGVKEENHTFGPGKSPFTPTDVLETQSNRGQFISRKKQKSVFTA